MRPTNDSDSINLIAFYVISYFGDIFDAIAISLLAKGIKSRKAILTIH